MAYRDLTEEERSEIAVYLDHLNQAAWAAVKHLDHLNALKTRYTALITAHIGPAEKISSGERGSRTAAEWDAYSAAVEADLASIKTFRNAL